MKDYDSWRTTPPDEDSNQCPQCEKFTDFGKLQVGQECCNECREDFLIDELGEISDEFAQTGEKELLEKSKEINKELKYLRSR